MDPFIISPTTKPEVPILLSVPHCGTVFPNEVRLSYKQDLIQAPDDTDWFVHDLYNFANQMGITTIRARYSRWVVDLNRDPQSKPLYNDGRIITGLCTTTDFHGNDIYENQGPDAAEVQRRVEKYYTPYHQKVQELLDGLKQKFGKVLLWDAHSIRHYVPTIRKEVFPDMILGSADETSAHPKLIKAALEGLSAGSFGVSHNHPFKGGQITRSFGKPDENQHALQLEMNKILYMDDEELVFDEQRADKIRAVLHPTFEHLIQTLDTL